MLREEERTIEVRIRWTDCFKFWVSGFLFILLLAFLVTLIALFVPGVRSWPVWRILGGTLP